MGEWWHKGFGCAERDISEISLRYAAIFANNLGDGEWCDGYREAVAAAIKRDMNEHR